jgi:hypothetical protein
MFGFPLKRFDQTAVRFEPKEQIMPIPVITGVMKTPDCGKPVASSLLSKQFLKESQRSESALSGSLRPFHVGDSDPSLNNAKWEQTRR